MFEFFTEALDVAVEWIMHFDPSLTEEDVRGFIADQVADKDIQVIMNRLSALSEVQEDI